MRGTMNGYYEIRITGPGKCSTGSSAFSTTPTVTGSSNVASTGHTSQLSMG
jgi:hypothetical protein